MSLIYVGSAKLPLLDELLSNALFADNILIRFEHLFCRIQHFICLNVSFAIIFKSIPTLVWFSFWILFFTHILSMCKLHLWFLAKFLSNFFNYFLQTHQLHCCIWAALKKSWNHSRYLLHIVSKSFFPQAIFKFHFLILTSHVNGSFWMINSSLDKFYVLHQLYSIFSNQSKIY